MMGLASRCQWAFRRFPSAMAAGRTKVCQRSPVVPGMRGLTSCVSIKTRFKSSYAVEHDVDDFDRCQVHVKRSGQRYGANIDNEGSGVVLSFPASGNNFVSSYFHAPWLWSNDPTYVHTTSGQRRRTPGQYPGTKIASVELLEHTEEVCTSGAIKPIPVPPKGCFHPVGTVFEHADDGERPTLLLRVEWDPEDGDDQSSVSYYSVEWLRQWRYDDQALHRRRQQSEVFEEHAVRRIENGHDGLVHVDYNSLTSTNRGDARFELLHAVLRDGAAIVDGAPLDMSEHSSPVANIARSLGGYLSHGYLYGDLFHVRASPDAHNIAYTSVPLQPHQDLAYYESAPGLQLLHCVENRGVHGGESVLVDAMAAANFFRQVASRYFETLTKCSATFVKQRDGADMVYRRPHIELGVGSAVDSMHGEIVRVTWSPPFEGPLCLPSHYVEAYYEAYAAFERTVDNSLPQNRDDDVLPGALGAILRDYAEEHTWERQLKPGEILVFNNRRMLHGRRGFTINGDAEDVGHGRHLVGAYTNIDDTLNEYRCLRRDREHFPIRNAGNGTTSGF